MSCTTGPKWKNSPNDIENRHKRALNLAIFIEKVDVVMYDNIYIVVGLGAFPYNL